MKGGSARLQAELRRVFMYPGFLFKRFYQLIRSEESYSKCMISLFFLELSRVGQLTMNKKLSYKPLFTKPTHTRLKRNVCHFIYNFFKFIQTTIIEIFYILHRIWILRDNGYIYFISTRLCFQTFVVCKN